MPPGGAAQIVKPVTFFASFKSLTFLLWDEQRRKLVGFGGLKRQVAHPTTRPAPLKL